MTTSQWEKDKQLIEKNKWQEKLAQRRKITNASQQMKRDFSGNQRNVD